MNVKTRLIYRVTDLIAGLLRWLGLGNGSNWCAECGALPGRRCTTPYCYGSLGHDEN
jgi:hypothetical protein